MADLFDPYFHWLGIPLDQRPMNHYRLLGLQYFEPDQHLIARAADQATYQLRGYELGPTLQLAQQLLAEVAAARACLLDPTQKLLYDQQLSMALTSPQPNFGGAAYPMGDAQLSPERPLAPPPPPAGGMGPAPMAMPFGMQPMTPTGSYIPPPTGSYIPPPTPMIPTLQAPPPPLFSQPAAPTAQFPLPASLMAPGQMPGGPTPSGHAPSPFPMPAGTRPAGTRPAGFPVGQGTAAPRPLPTVPPAAAPAPPAAIPAPPVVEDAAEDDLLRLPESSSLARRRQRARQRSQEKSYLFTGAIGALLFIMLFVIFIARHPIEDMFFSPSPQRATPVVKPKPPESESETSKKKGKSGIVKFPQRGSSVITRPTDRAPPPPQPRRNDSQDVPPLDIQ